MSELVIFDLDNTLIKGQSQKILLDYAFKKRLISPLFYIKTLIWFLFYHLGLVKDPRKIMEYVFGFLEGKDINKFENIIDDCFEKKLKKCIFREAIKIFREHVNLNREILIISNAIELIPRKFAKFLGAKYFIGTKFEKKDSNFTGKIEGDIIYGRNKVDALRKFIKRNNLSLTSSWAYSDHETDIPLLVMVTHPFAVNPDRGLYKKAKKKRWPILKFKELI